MNSPNLTREELRKLEKRCKLEKIEQYNTRNWMRVHGKVPEIKRKQRNDLKKLFDELDSDNTGVISIEELYEPLLSLGIVNNKQEVEHLVSYASSKKSGILKFEEFLKIFDAQSLKPKDRLEKLLNNISGNMDSLRRNDLPLKISMCSQRRALMMQAFISENNTEKERGLKVINAFAIEMNSTGSPSKCERIVNRRKSEFSETRTLDRQKRLQTLSMSEKKGDSFINYLPPKIQRASFLINE